MARIISSPPPSRSTSTPTSTLGPDSQDTFNPYPHQKTLPGSAPGEQTYPKVLDPYTGRYVSTKPANMPFLAHQRYKASKAAADAAAAAGKDENANGNDGRTRSESQTTERGMLGWLKTVAWAIMLACVLGRFITGSPVWGYEDEIRSVWNKHLWKPRQIQFNLDQLSEFTGKNPDRPIYLSISGKVYDVSSSARIYGPGGSYGMLTGKDASRAFVTGCFQNHHLNHDLRGIGPAELKSLTNWEKFFANHKRYVQVGTVSLPPVDPREPIPGPCIDSAPNPPATRRGTDPAVRAPPVPPVQPEQTDEHDKRATLSEHKEL
ncbi:Putative steroid membrane receptor Hpr6.6/25-Dx [Phaffia rhodozyma]|uniref:Putative steroid membrane receptor Hpr6.6/25-Dx n=1 Tax=Phaffia rhodozyma TaxID=264483 RepID=A0A0F7SEM4_PHARH|nr:Putative steroid membrane receptor Hpr6.6/25-Dx [Phaffia rhodozyma]